MVYVIQVCRQLSTRTRMELQFINTRNLVGVNNYHWLLTTDLMLEIYFGNKGE